MRKRFRGNAPIGSGGDGHLEGGTGAGEGKSGQLYGGRPAFEVVKGRSGLEKENQMDPEKTRGL